MTTGDDPRVLRSRALILDASQRVFLTVGYHDATLDRVAAEAGLAKRTIYNLYVDKATLFRETVLSAIAVAAAFTQSLTSELQAGEDKPHNLVDVAVRLAEATLLGPAIALRRLVIMESLRFPQLAVLYRAGAPDAVMSALSGIFARMSGDGYLRPCDPLVAAEHFSFLIMGADLDRGTFSGERPSAERARARAILGAEAFCRAYAP